MNLLANLLFGHLVGDFLLQNKWMAISKGNSTYRCMIHCVIYMATVCLFTWDFRCTWALLVFASHFPIDRWSLADKWLKLINGRSLEDFFANGHKDVVGKYWEEKLNYQILRGGFTTLVYGVCDNTMHLVIMWYGHMLLAT